MDLSDLTPVAFAVALVGCTSPPAVAPIASVPRPTVAAAAVRDFAAAVAETDAAFARDAGHLWATSFVDVPFLGVEGQRLYATRDPHVAGFVRDDAGLWEGSVPAGMDLAQTAKTWAGRSWAMVFVPVDHERPDPVRILAHEAFHVIEPRVLGASGDQTPGDGADLLDDETGRPWFRLELRALMAAVISEPRSATQRTAARDAVRFRRQLDAVASPSERARERGLDRWEGLAEYSGMKLAGATAAEVVAGARAGESSDSSFLRSAAYIRVPAYGYVLDDVAPAWRTLATKGQDPADALRAAVGETTELSAAEARYDAAAVRAQERERHVRHLRLVAELRARFVDGPVIVVHLAERDVVFDPRGQVQLGAAGVVMRGFHWNGAEGAALDAPEGALLDMATGVVRLPRGAAMLAEGPVVTPADLTGAGWTLHLPSGWTARTSGNELHLSR